MRHLVSVLLTGALAAGCAVAAPGEPPPKAIDDVEPEVTREVAAALSRMAGDAGAEAAPLLRGCPAAVPLELLRRTTKGEERSYLYRGRCQAPLLVSVTYGKAANIKQLSVKAE